ncbi:MAG: RNA polymerase sigma factor [Polyangiaceae bacterium]|nr:RNA polymerase sigma factor [Polyangiaceae bacterium]
MNATLALPGTLRRRLRWLARRLRVSSQDVGDLVQAVYLDLLESGHMELAHASPGRVDGVAKNLVRKEQRREAWVALLPDEIPDETTNPELLVMMKQKAEFWRTMLAEVPADYRVVFVDHRILGLSYSEIAAARGISVSTAHERSQRGLEHLARAVGRWQAEQRRRGRDDTVPLLWPDVSASQRIFRAARAPVVRALAVLAALLVAGVAMVDTTEPASRMEPELRHPTPSFPLEPAPAPSAVPAPAPVPGPLSSPPTAVPAVPPRAAPSAPPSNRAPGDPLEMELIKRARAALSIGDEEGARGWLEQHLLRFPRGSHARERDALLAGLAH